MRLSIIVDAVAECRILAAPSANQITSILEFGARLIAATIEGEVLVRRQRIDLEAGLARAEVAFTGPGPGNRSRIAGTV